MCFFAHCIQELRVENATYYQIHESKIMEARSGLLKSSQSCTVSLIDLFKHLLFFPDQSVNCKIPVSHNLGSGEQQLVEKLSSLTQAAARLVEDSQVKVTGATDQEQNTLQYLEHLQQKRATRNHGIHLEKREFEQQARTLQDTGEALKIYAVSRKR